MPLFKSLSRKGKDSTHRHPEPALAPASALAPPVAENNVKHSANPDMLAAPTPTPGTEKSVYYDADDASNEHIAHAAASTDTVTPLPAANGTGTGLDIDAATFGTAQNGGADVTRKPSVAAGALEPREPAGGGILANNKEGSHLATNGAYDPNVRDSGYTAAAPESDTAGAGAGAGAGPKGKRASVAFAPHDQDIKQAPIAETAAEMDQPSPEYATLENHGQTYGAGDSKVAPAAIATGATGGSTIPQNTHQALGQGRPESPTSLTSSTERRHASAAGAFANGAAVTGPDAVPDENATQHQRSATAESHLSAATKAKITKSELKDAKRLSKVIKAEGSAQSTNLSAFLKELTKIQKVQRAASKDESHALSASGKAASRAHKLHTKFLAAKAAHEQADADAKAKAEYLEAARTHAQNTTAELSTKTRELEELRRAKAVDDREREAKLIELTQIGKA